MFRKDTDFEAFERVMVERTSGNPFGICRTGRDSRDRHEVSQRLDRLCLATDLELYDGQASVPRMAGKYPSDRILWDADTEQAEGSTLVETPGPR